MKIMIEWSISKLTNIYIWSYDDFPKIHSYYMLIFSVINNTKINLEYANAYGKCGRSFFRIGVLRPEPMLILVILN